MNRPPTDPVAIAFAEEEVPYLNRDQMVEVDRAMIDDYRIDLVRMMENAGRNLAALARQRFLDGDPRGRAITVLAGAGGNGGGVLVAARRLANWGATVRAELATGGSVLTPVPAAQLAILEHLGVPWGGPPGGLPDGRVDLVLDGLIGYSLRGAPRGRSAKLIEWANSVDAPVLALDVPSGLDVTTGFAYEPVIVAAATMTLALPKEGLRSDRASNVVGELYLADISVPPGLYAGPSLGLAVGPIFAKSEIVRLR